MVASSSTGLELSVLWHWIMLYPHHLDIIDFPPDSRPLLTVTVDAEEEFDWSKPISRCNTAVTSMRHQETAHCIFERYRVKPTYLVDYPVATLAEGRLPLIDLLKDGACEIGAHLHPWVNPPFEEPVSVHTSYPGNLPASLEQAKLASLTSAIEDNFGLSPKIYRAGRFGVGPATAGILERLGYEVDTSVVPETDFRKSTGPDFRGCSAKPYWFGNADKLLELPVSVSFTGLLSRIGGAIYPLAAAGPARSLHLSAVLARSGLLERIRLTPEGVSLNELRRLTRAMLKTGHRVFTLIYHSPSLAPGNTPYVSSNQDLAQFLDRLRGYLDFFFGEVGGSPATIPEIRSLSMAISSSSTGSVCQAGDG